MESRKSYCQNCDHEHTLWIRQGELPAPPAPCKRCFALHWSSYPRKHVPASFVLTKEDVLFLQVQGIDAQQSTEDGA